MVVQSDLVDYIDQAIEQVLSSQTYTLGQHLIQNFKQPPLSSNFMISLYFNNTLNFLLNKLEYHNFDGTNDQPVGLIQSWDYLANYGAESQITSTPATMESLKETDVLALEFMNDLLYHLTEKIKANSTYQMDTSKKSILTLCLQISTLCAIHLKEPPFNLIAKLEEILLSICGRINLEDCADLSKVTFDSLGCLSHSFPEQLEIITNLFFKFVISYPPEEDRQLDNYAFYEIREVLCSRMAFSVKNRPDIATSNIHSLTNYMLSLNFTSQNNSQNNDSIIVENILAAMAKIGLISTNPDVAKLSITMLCQQINRVSPNLTGFILERLSQLLLKAPESSYKEILEVFSLLSQKEGNPEGKNLMSAILKSFYSISYQIHDYPEKIPSFLKFMLSLANDKGVAIHKNLKEKRKGVQMTGISGELGILLPVIGNITKLQEFQPHLEADEDLKSQYRNLWFYCVIFDFVSETSWVKEWKNSMIDIASKTPLLVPESSGNYLEVEIEYNTVLRLGADESEVSKFKHQLTEILPTRTTEIRSLTYAQTIFLLAVYHIETMRASTGNFSFVLNYFTNQCVIKSKLLVLIESIAEQVFTNYVQSCQRRPAGYSVDQPLYPQLKQLLINSCHRVQKMHSMSLKCAKSLLETFPQLLLHSPTLFVTLELCQLLWASCEAEFHDEYCPIFEFRSDLTGIQIELPDSYEYRQALYSKFLESVRKWLLTIKTLSPLDTDHYLQSYLFETERTGNDTNSHVGRSLAMEYCKMPMDQSELSEVKMNTNIRLPDYTSKLTEMLLAKSYHLGKVTNIKNQVKHSRDPSTDYITKLHSNLKEIYELTQHHKHVAPATIKDILYEAASWQVSNSEPYYALLKYLVWIPVYAFTSESMKTGVAVWTWISTQRPDLSVRLMTEMEFAWDWSIEHHKGLFSSRFEIKSPFVQKMSYTPTDPQAKLQSYRVISNALKPHSIWTQFLTSRFHAFKHSNPDLVHLLTRLLLKTFNNSRLMSNHPLVRENRFRLLHLGLQLLQKNHMDPIYEYLFRKALYSCAFEWFSSSPQWSSSGNKQQCISEFVMLVKFNQALESDKEALSLGNQSHPIMELSNYSNSSLRNTLPLVSNPKMDKTILDQTREDAILLFQRSRRLLQLLTENEIAHLHTLNNPCPDHGQLFKMEYIGYLEKTMTEDSWKNMTRFAWSLDPKLALNFLSRFKSNSIETELINLVGAYPIQSAQHPEALTLFLHQRSSAVTADEGLGYRWLMYWAPVPPISATSYLLSPIISNTYVLQYCMRTLHHFPVEEVFFYVPQIVQALRYDSKLGYAEKFILDAARVSQLFAHQIIWNMKANFYRNEETLEEDNLKPTLEKVIEKIVNNLDGGDKDFYEREFAFFNEVTGISGKLKPYIKKSKPEKKAKIDEEMAKIKVDVGVYLPSNPEGEVIGIDYKSGRPLQSHAKAPFMATFHIRKPIETNVINEDPRTPVSESHPPAPLYQEGMLSAIFKVGDDCRQDVLALQLIAIFKNIFANVGLDLYLFPYRIVATAPGCGVIDVIPNSISRDQLGREKVNNLNNYFLAKYGGEDSIEYQKVRNCFIQSLAAYSVVSYLIQIKDRHNGNIMIDDNGHIIHIDFGFILEISPGGINFESSPFKLTTEMIQVMGGAQSSQAYKWFAELCVKAYLACR